MTRARRTAKSYLDRARDQLLLDSEQTRRDAMILALFRAKDVASGLKVADIRGVLSGFGFPYRSDEALWQAYYRAEKNAESE